MRTATIQSDTTVLYKNSASNFKKIYASLAHYKGSNHYHPNIPILKTSSPPVRTSSSVPTPKASSSTATADRRTLDDPRDEGEAAQGPRRCCPA
jgi:hypothetical protein